MWVLSDFEVFHCNLFRFMVPCSFLIFKVSLNVQYEAKFWIETLVWVLVKHNILMFGPQMTKLFEHTHTMKFAFLHFNISPYPDSVHYLHHKRNFFFVKIWYLRNTPRSERKGKIASLCVFQQWSVYRWHRFCIIFDDVCVHL